MLRKIAGIMVLGTILVAGCGKDAKNPVASGGTDPAVLSVGPDNTAIGNRVWKDLNQNGIQGTPSAEPGFPGVLVDLYTCAGQFVARDTTDAQGTYLFQGLAPGDYKILFHLPAGWAFTLKNATNLAQDSDAEVTTGWTSCTSIAADEFDLTWDAGVYELPQPQPAAIGDRVWNDVDQDGIQDDGELGIEGITIHLLTCDGAMVAEDVTDDLGNYLFENVPAGDYEVHFVVPGGYVVSPADQGGNDTLDSDADATGLTACTTLTAGETDLTVDAGLYVEQQGGGCTRTPGYWKNHPEAIVPLLPVWLGTAGGPKSVNVTTDNQAVSILKHPNASNGIQKLYCHLLATKLNIRAGANGNDVASVISAADTFLSTHNANDWNALTQAQKNQVLAWKDACDAYNNGDTGPGHCD